MTDNLPARQADTFGDDVRNVPLADAPTVALAFALGYAAARPQSANQFGPFCAMVEELMGRGGADSQWTVLMRLLPMPLARSLGMLYQAQRGQRWAATGRRHGTNPTNTGNS